MPSPSYTDQPTDAAPFTAREIKALKTLSERRRLIVQVVPERASDEFCARLSAWVNLCLDVKLMLPVPVPATRAGDALACPYCKAPIRAAFKADPDQHAEDCEWRKAILRWAYTNTRIDREFDAT